MEDYDPKTFRSTRGDALAAWALCTLLLAALMIGSFVNSCSNLDEQTVSVAANSSQGSMQAKVPAHKIVSSCDQRRSGGDRRPAGPRPSPCRRAPDENRTNPRDLGPPGR